VPDAIGDLRAFIRFGGGTITPWRYSSPGILERPAQAHDGTLYAVETVLSGRVVEGQRMLDKFAIAIDGASGRLIARTQFPADVNEFIAKYDGEVTQTVPPVYCRSYRYETGPEVAPPVAGADGRGYFLVNRRRIIKRDLCIEPKVQRAERTIDRGVDLVVLSRSAAPRTVSIYAIACEAPAGSTLPCDYAIRTHQLMPDGIGGTLVTWERGTAAGLVVSLTRVDADGSLTERAFDSHSWIEMIGQDGVALTYGGAWAAIDVRNGDIKWNGQLANLTPLAARPDGGVAAIDWSDNTLATVNGSGEIESRHPFGLDWRSFYSGGDWIGMKGESIAAVVGDFSDATRFSYFDTKTGQQRERMPGIGIWLKTHDALIANVFQHASIRVTPYDQEWLLKNRSRFEACAASERCVPLGKDNFGYHFFTIGAGAGTEDTNLQCNGILTKGFNRPNDVTKAPTQPLAEIPIDWRLQSLLINSLISRVDGFANTLAYHCFPEERPGHFNSNSFTHGLLHAAGVGHDETPPTRKRLPGWITPVPRDAFFKQ
jgi:hypothetical protein